MTTGHADLSVHFLEPRFCQATGICTGSYAARTLWSTPGSGMRQRSAKDGHTTVMFVVILASPMGKQSRDSMSSKYNRKGQIRTVLRYRNPSFVGSHGKCISSVVVRQNFGRL